MTIFPTAQYTFKLIGEESETLERLERRTEISEKLISKVTDKSFIGTVKNNKFRIISSEIGKGAFCVLNGEISNQRGKVTIDINKAFKVLITIILFLPVIGIVIQTFSAKENSPIFFLVALLQILMIRFIFIELAFRNLSKRSLNKLRDVLDIDSIEKKLKLIL